jgi:hypothetical protein
MLRYSHEWKALDGVVRLNSSHLKIVDPAHLLQARRVDVALAKKLVVKYARKFI